MVIDLYEIKDKRIIIPISGIERKTPRLFPEAIIVIKDAMQSSSTRWWGAKDECLGMKYYQVVRGDN